MQSEIPSKPKGLPGAKVATAAELVNYQEGDCQPRNSQDANWECDILRV